MREKHDKILDQIDRRKLLLDKLFFHAKDIGLMKITIQSGENNKRTKTKWDNPYVDKGTVHLPLELAQKLYDKYAEKMGFEKDPEDNNWHKAL